MTVDVTKRDVIKTRVGYQTGRQDDIRPILTSCSLPNFAPATEAWAVRMVGSGGRCSRERHRSIFNAVLDDLDGIVLVHLTRNDRLHHPARVTQGCPAPEQADFRSLVQAGGLLITVMCSGASVSNSCMAWALCREGAMS